MMSPMLIALALLLQAQEPPKPPPAAPKEDLTSLEKRIFEREARRGPLERKIREAVDRNETETAQRLNQEFKENEGEIDALKKKRDEIKAERGTHLGDNVSLSGQALLTRFDNQLGLNNAFGWGASMTFGRHLYFEYQRWDTRDNVGNASATVQSYQLGVTQEHGFGLEGDVTFAMSAGVGLVHFSSDATRCDSGPMASLRPEWKYYYNSRSSISLGGDFDFVWTDFNQAHTHPRQNQSFFLSIEVAF
jgi:opacity protein-like surface antigen